MPKETLAIALDALLHGFGIELADERTNSSAEHSNVHKTIITKSLQLASPDTASKRNDQNAGLRSVFDRIELKASPNSGSHYFSQKPLSGALDSRPLPIFPETGPGPGTPSDYRDQLKQLLSKVCKEMKDDLDILYAHCLSLLQQYAWCIPAENQSYPPDISLYDQARVVSALAACLHKHHESFGTLNEDDILREGQTRCVLLAGDVSGIQDYIFAISTTGAGGVAKRLRARSFFVQMLSDVAGLRLLRQFDLPLANLLMASGGNFYLLLPNLPGTEDELKRLQSEFNRWLLDQFHGALTISLAWTPVGDGEFADGHFGKVNERLHGSLREKKKQRLADQLQNEQGWLGWFVRPEEFQGEQVCKSCYRFPAKHYSSKDDEKRDKEKEEHNPDICSQCFDQQQLGKDLTRAKYVSFYDKSPHGYDCLGWKFSLSEVPPSPHLKPYLVVRFNDPDLGKARGLPATFRYQANHVRYKDDKDEKGAKTPWTFSEIAAEREFESDNETTTKLLGVLKADVDYLGQVFQEGLRRDEPEKGFDSIARIAALSRQLDWFFSGWLEWLLTNDARFQSCYTVYSGGDDLLIVGPRAKSLELARTINEEFERYTGHSRITISAGIAVVKSKLPLAHTVKLADMALDKAKGDDDAGRNSICLLDDVIKWPEFGQVYREIEKLNAMAADKTVVPSGFLYFLVYMSELYRSYKQDGKVEGLLYHPLLAYQIERVLKKELEIRKWAEDLLRPQLEIANKLGHLRLIAQWVILERRHNGNDDIGREDGTTEM